ncbi:hypothetical protein AVEN_175572-1 [Araneus ventricosus]|uniref:Uncharacterized protein n=1 Tax=Araneus ventricosus TaxID=182803 RepID=A0A4Y2I3S2_ARAVE|nr:hypothetical protein AVEN_175572-1 [Araneus ventricosus]
MDLPEHIRMDITSDNLPPNSISYARARMTSRSSGPMKSLNFPPYSKSSKEWEYATRRTAVQVENLARLFTMPPSAASCFLTTSGVQQVNT